MLRYSASAFVLFLSVTTADAATYSVSGIVTESAITPAGEGAPLLIYPPVGSDGVLTYTINGADDAPLMNAPDSFPSGDNFGFTAYLDVGGWMADFLTSPVTNVEGYFSDPSQFRISGTDITADGETGTFAGSLRFFFDAPLALTPATYGDLRAAIAAGSTVSFSYNGNSYGGGNWVSFAFEGASPPPAPVPLPATALLLAGALAAMTRLRRRVG